LVGGSQYNNIHSVFFNYFRKNNSFSFLYSICAQSDYIHICSPPLSSIWDSDCNLYCSFYRINFNVVCQSEPVSSWWWSVLLDCYFISSADPNLA